MSSNKSYSLFLNSIRYNTENQSVVYSAIVDGKEIALSGRVSGVAGIRSVVMSDELEKFLRPFCANDPGIVKRLVNATWRAVDGESLEYPIQI
ncbi:hypothetical protein [Lysobacter enzymogenes]|uniref:hypothetical protein n=1 Tax=Lysobacter enzymogenes TaxID=69 RepID=UPI0019D020AD|nr:hypothetical protein [Lysobacter enzymogenes]